VWVVLSVIFLCTFLVKFYPNYTDNEFPLFTDITLIIFLPSYFALTWLVTHFASIFIKNKKVNIAVGGMILIIAFIYSLKIMEFNMIIKSIMSFVGIIVGFIHYFITTNLFKNSLLTIKEKV